MKRRDALLALAVMPFGRRARAEARMRHIESIDERLRLVTAEGDRLKLVGIEPILLPDMREWLLEVARGQRLLIRSLGRFDRWGAELALVHDADGKTLQAQALRRGLALLRPQAVEDALRDAWQEAESRARQSTIGLWGGTAPLAPIAHHDAASVLGQYALITGRVLHAEAGRRYAYLNFGEVWRRDFTIRAHARAAKAMARNGLDLAGLAGSRVEVRGVVFEENGPMIELDDRAALRVLSPHGSALGLLEG